MLTISNYHYIRPTFDAKHPSIFGVTPEVFKNQLLLLKEKGTFISSDELLNNHDAILKSKENFILITFDDGLKEQYEYALPILNALEIPAIFFANSRNYLEKKVSTVHKIHLLRSIFSSTEILEKITIQNDLVSLSNSDKLRAQEIYIYDDKESAILKYLLNFKMDFLLQEQVIKTFFDANFNESEVLEELYMSEQEIIALANLNFLGSHTHNHYPIGLLNPQEIEFELKTTKLFFENLTNKNIEMVAYPYGNEEACTDEVALIAERVGYKFGFTTTRGINTTENNYLLLNRFDCNDLPGGKNYLK